MAIVHKWSSLSYTSEAFPTSSSFSVSRGGIANGDYVLLIVNSPWSATPSSVPSGFGNINSFVGDPSSGYLHIYAKYLTNAAGEPDWYVNYASATEGNVVAICYSGVHSTGWATFTQTYQAFNAAISCPNITNGSAPQRQVLHIGVTWDDPWDWGTAVSTTVENNVPSGAGSLNLRANMNGNLTGSDQGHSTFVYDRNLGNVATGGNTGGLDMNILSGFDNLGVTLVLKAANAAPSAPTLVSPIGSISIDRTVTNRFSWVFNDEAYDSQSRYIIQYRLVGAGTWTTVDQVSTNQYHDFAGSTFAAGNYEWQCRTYDSTTNEGGAVAGPFSGSGFFTAAAPTTAPTITAPTNNGTVTANPSNVTWTVTNQSSYEVRTVADNAGAPNTSIVYYSSSEVVQSGTRSHSVPFPTNGRVEHVQVRVKFNGLWSTWSSVKITVTYTAPPTPTFTLTANNTAGTLTIAINNPTPGGGQPALAENQVFIDDGLGEGLTRRAVAIAEDASYVYRTPRFGYDYNTTNVRVRAVGVNTATADSAS